ncbi:hypothetical protein D3C87_1574320 [compost metagenome]
MDYERIGRARMMVRLPNHRRQLAQLKIALLCDLLENYGLAVVKRDELRARRVRRDLVAEYDELCQGIEDDAIQLIELLEPRLVR